MFATIYTKLNPTEGVLSLPLSYRFNGDKILFSEETPFPTFEKSLTTVYMMSQSDSLVRVLKAVLSREISSSEGTDILSSYFGQPCTVEFHTPDHDRTAGKETAKVKISTGNNSGISAHYSDSYGKDGITFYVYEYEREDKPSPNFPEKLRVEHWFGVKPMQTGEFRASFKVTTPTGEVLPMTLWNVPEEFSLDKGMVLTRASGKKFYVKDDDRYGRQLSLTAGDILVF